MPDDFVSDEIPPGNFREDFERPPGTRLEWMNRLGSSLEHSRKALLLLDLDGIEQGTREQRILVRQGEFLRGSNPLPDLGDELRQAGARVRDAARLQAALLARMQGKLRVLGNMLAGTGVLYTRPLARYGERPGRRIADRQSL